MDFLFERFASAPGSIAFNDRGRTFTYGQIIETTERFEGRLAEVGVAPGDVVVVVGDYSPEIVCLLFALARRRNIFVPVTRESVIEREVIEPLA